MPVEALVIRYKRCILLRFDLSRSPVIVLN